MSTPCASRANRLRDLLGAAVVAVGVCFTLTADARPEASQAPAAPLAERLREANDSLRRIAPPDSDSAARSDADPAHNGSVRWGNYFGNFNPWRNWNNWPNWHNFNQWHNF
ncbi:MAG: hypothetical protein ACLP1X_21225 [Polyangiaceae bacterium]